MNIDKIRELKKIKNAVILAHYYTNPAIQDAADYVGDSYYLSKMGRECQADIIIFCGVRFMAESAKLLSPEKRVFVPKEEATCGMARRVDIDKVIQMKKEHEDAVLVSYINCSTELKGISHTCVTSSSAEKIISQIHNKKILFVPDKNLGGYIADKFPNKEFILWDGCCCIHNNVTPDMIMSLKEEHPKAAILVHPECRASVRDMADYIGSTSGILEHASESRLDEFIVVTDSGILHQLERRNPHKKFYNPNMVCGNMKITKLEDVYRCLDEERNEIIISQDLAHRASRALKNMHDLAEK